MIEFDSLRKGRGQKGYDFARLCFYAKTWKPFCRITSRLCRIKLFLRTLKIVKKTKTPARRGAQCEHINFKNDETSLNVRLLRANPNQGVVLSEGE